MTSTPGKGHQFQAKEPLKIAKILWQKLKLAQKLKFEKKLIEKIESS
jgi:hypothetical protein